MTDPNYNQQPGYQAQQQPNYQQPQQPYQAPAGYQQPYAAAPESFGADMPGTHKAAWFFIGMFTGIAGILIASMVNVDKPYRSEGTKWAVIGCFFWLIVCLLFVFGGCSAAMITSAVGY